MGVRKSLCCEGGLQLGEHTKNVGVQYYTPDN